MRRLRQLVRRWLASPAGRRVLAGASMVAASLLCGITAAAEHEAGHGGEHGAPHLNLWAWDDHAPPTGWFLVDFAIFIGLLIYLTHKPIAAMFVKRHQTIKAAIETAQAAHASAQAHHDEYRDKLARVEEDITAFIAGAKQDGRAEKERIIAGAHDYSRQLRQDTDSAVAQEIESARRRLHEEVVTQILHDAQATIIAELDDKDRKRLLEQAIAEFEDGGDHFTRIEARSAL